MPFTVHGNSNGIADVFHGEFSRICDIHGVTARYRVREGTVVLVPGDVIRYRDVFLRGLYPGDTKFNGNGNGKIWMRFPASVEKKLF